MSNKLLQATGDELSRLADGIFSGPFQHDVDAHGTHHVKCNRCGEVIPLMDRWDVKERFPCWVSPFDDLIPLTWPEAMKYRDWAIRECGSNGLRDAFIAMYLYDEPQCKHIKHEALIRYVSYYYLMSAQPSDYIKAACLCKLKETK